MEVRNFSLLFSYNNQIGRSGTGDLPRQARTSITANPPSRCVWPNSGGMALRAALVSRLHDGGILRSCGLAAWLSKSELQDEWRVSRPQGHYAFHLRWHGVGGRNCAWITQLESVCPEPVLANHHYQWVGKLKPTITRAVSVFCFLLTGGQRRWNDCRRRGRGCQGPSEGSRAGYGGRSCCGESRRHYASCYVPADRSCPEVMPRVWCLES
jgi:hypothetical protein